MSLTDSITVNTQDIISAESLSERLAGGRPLRVKHGVDPTRPDLTFGHLVQFNKLRQFQELGHQAVLIIGDFTARIGDPSGKSATRPVLTEAEIEANAATYLDQAFKVLDRDRTTVSHNSEWFDSMKFEDTLNLARGMTVARMLERDDFAKRYTANTPISIVEFLYPLVQGYDSLMVNADVELGGTDQLFNMLVGRNVQRDAGKPEQIVITMPLLVGLDGVKKMSKSEDNYIAFNDSVKDMFGKIMSISDEAMWDYHRLLLLVPEARINELKNEHPMAVKKDLAQRLTARLLGKDTAQHERDQFEKVFSRRESRDDMLIFTWSQIAPDNNDCRLAAVLSASDLFSSNKEARRLIEQGAVKVDGERRSDPNQMIAKPDREVVIQAGKRTFFKLVP
jgi:tyrosyl-tRNA synthetase